MTDFPDFPSGSASVPSGSTSDASDFASDESDQGEACSECGAVGECSTCDNCGNSPCDSACHCFYCHSCNENVDDQCQCGCGTCQRRNRCPDCCRHAICDSCDYCLDSGNCTCWRCEDCDRCGDGDFGVCDSDPDRCTECCNCGLYDSVPGNGYDDEPLVPSGHNGHISFKRYPLTFWSSKLGEFRSNTLKRFLSVEIEVAGADSFSNTELACYAWKSPIVQDGSLPSAGFEINTAPANGDKFLEEIRDLTAALRDDGAGINIDCGLHVHVDARDLRPLQIRGLVELYCKLEPFLFAALPDSRQGNDYTIPCGRTYKASILDAAGFRPKDIKAKTIESVYGQGILDVPTELYRYNYDLDRAETVPNPDRRPSAYLSEKRQHRGGNRYYALNLHSYFHRGTVEFRHAAGSINFTKITKWARLCGYIVEAAASLGTHKLLSIARSIEHPPERSWGGFARKINARELASAAAALRLIAPDDVVDWFLTRVDKFGRYES
jgi:hypothetical protein